MIHIRNTVILGIVVALIIGFAAGFAISRSRYRSLLEANSNSIISRDDVIRKLQQESAGQKMMAKKDVVYGLQNGKLVANDNGNMSVATESVTFSNKTKLAQDGTVTRLDGSKFKLVQGEWYSVK